jgi:hypothetical protein
MIAEQRAIEITKLQDLISAHEKETVALTVENKTLKYVCSFAIFSWVYASHKPHREALALFANDYHESSRATGRILSTIRSGNLPAKPAPRKHADCPKVGQWTRKDYKNSKGNAQRGETDGNATSVHHKKKTGRPPKGSEDDVKVTHFYLQNEDGTPVDEDQIAEMSRKARMLWRTLDEDGMAPATFGQISMKAWEYFSRTMLADEAHEFLLLCDDGEWKLREWSTRSYPSWHRNQLTQSEKDAAGNTQDGKLLLSIPRVANVNTCRLVACIGSCERWCQCKRTEHRQQRRQRHRHTGHWQRR